MPSTEYSVVLFANTSVGAGMDATANFVTDIGSEFWVGQRGGREGGREGGRGGREGGRKEGRKEGRKDGWMDGWMEVREGGRMRRTNERGGGGDR